MNYGAGSCLSFFMPFLSSSLIVEVFDHPERVDLSITVDMLAHCLFSRFHCFYLCFAHSLDCPRRYGATWATSATFD
jgi:hypothetical protein